MDLAGQAESGVEVAISAHSTKLPQSHLGLGTEQNIALHLHYYSRRARFNRWAFELLNEL